MSGECMCDVCGRLGQSPSHNQVIGKSCRSQSLQIDHLRPSFHHFSPHSAHLDENMLSQETLRYLETDSNPHTLRMAQQFQSLMAQPNASMKMNETKPRIGKDEVDILECEFKRNPKPTTMAKRQFAKDMGVDLSRINNWFQNRRAKRKQEKKQEAYEAGQAQKALGQYPEPSSPDFYYANTPIHEPTTPFGLPSRPPPPVALYNPQYSDPSTASMESLHRTLAAAQAAAEHNEYHNFADLDSLKSLRGGSVVHGSANSDRADFSSPDDSIVHFDRSQYSYPSAFASNLYNGPPTEPQSQPQEQHTPTLFSAYPTSSEVEVSTPQAVTASPSELLTQFDGLPYHTNSNNSDSQSPENNIASTIAIGLNTIAKSDESSTSPLAPLNSLRSPPPPIDIASRRRKVQHKPGALIVDTLRTSRLSIGPRTVYHAEGFRRPMDTLLSSPVRRIISAGNRFVLSDRGYKSGVESAQRSPIDLGNFPDAFMKHNFHTHTIGQPPSLTEGSSLNSSLALPTPMSPREMETSRSTAPPKEGSMNFIFNAGAGCFTTMEEDQNFTSSPETPLAQMVIYPSSKNWPTMEYSEKRRSFEVPSETLLTPAHEPFPIELHIPQPSYLRATNPPKPFVFSQTTTTDFLDERKPRRCSINSASEDRSEQPQPIETGLPPVLAVLEEGRSSNDSTKVEEMKIKVEMGCHPEVSHQDEDVLQDNSCISDKPEPLGSSYTKECNAILSSAPDGQEGEQDDPILPILEPMRQALVERVMDEFYLIFDQDWAARITQHPGGGSSTSGDGKDHGTPVDKTPSPTSQQKRQRSQNEDSADESGNKKPRRQRGGLRSPGELNTPARFACPFRKHDPRKYSIYSHRVCALTSWDTIARVKEHLYRNHKAALYCKRCWMVFETEELLDSHAIAPAASICEALPGHPPEGITPKQVAELRSKAKPYSKQSEGSRWKEIFRLLFPSESVPSPYWEPVQEHAPSSPNSQVLVHYDDYMHRELPRLFRSRVEEVVRREMQPVEASLLANLEGLIRECQDRLSSGYRETHMTEQQSEVLPTKPVETLADLVDITNTAEHLHMIAVETGQQLSSEFFDAVLQPPPPQEEDYILDFSAADVELFGPYSHTPSGNLSDSGYASVPRCSCNELCRCPISMIGFENRDVDISEPSSVDLTRDLGAQAHGVQWQNWLENRD